MITKEQVATASYFFLQYVCVLICLLCAVVAALATIFAALCKMGVDELYDMRTNQGAYPKEFHPEDLVTAIKRWIQRWRKPKQPQLNDDTAGVAPVATEEPPVSDDEIVEAKEER